jgi:hypothetical protein
MFEFGRMQSASARRLERANAIARIDGAGQVWRNWQVREERRQRRGRPS